MTALPPKADRAAGPKIAPVTLRPRLDLFSVFVYVVVAGGIATQFALIAWLARR